MDSQSQRTERLATAITKSASLQTYYTIRFCVDRGRTADAYRAYGYFRWVDDVLDAPTSTQPDRLAFVQRQQGLLESCYCGAPIADLCPEEQILVDLVQHDTEPNSGLQLYLRNMMSVMIFDTERRGRLISQTELTDYSRKLAIAVTEAIHYFIGHAESPPPHEVRYLAVTAAHITHMLRDMLEDVDNGYFNIPHEVLHLHGITARDVNSQAGREWVYNRVKLARRYFRDGCVCASAIRNWRCRLATYAYIARFEWLLRVIEHDRYFLRAAYPERKSVWAGLAIGWSTLAAILTSTWFYSVSGSPITQSVRTDKG